ncbi:glutathione S-transferase family protein [Rubrobacter naiadicus]|uniref:glutathione S-transferase family protein n=1 Tax=Rubrobacter naiadicus TaxID=1392641 RepID=UPI002360C186|nr:glutathione S-transferase family protein [Rubrobacter naiadicus]
MAPGMMVEGVWKTERQEQDEGGRFIRPETSFRGRITADGSSGFPAESGRYHLYIAWACPWAHRTAIIRSLKGLEDAISISVVDPHMGEMGWEFTEGPGRIPDTVNGARYLHEIYALADPHYTGRCSTPVLWDKERRTIVNNESREILRMLDTEFGEFAKNDVDLCPKELREEIDATIDAIYEPINNGVYRAGFAATQKAYEEAVTELFEALDHWEEVLSGRRYLCGERLTEADICMFTTLYRFDPVYHYHFKCNLRRLRDYPNLWGYTRDIYQHPGVRETCHLDHIKEHYYTSHPHVNPTRVVPKGPIIDYDEPHGRG